MPVHPPSPEQLRRAAIANRLAAAGGLALLAFLTLITLGGAVAGRSVREIMDLTDDAYVLAWSAAAAGGLALAWAAVALALRSASQVRTPSRRSAVVVAAGGFLVVLSSVLGSTLVTQAIGGGTLVDELGTSGSMTGGQAVLLVTTLVTLTAAIVVLRGWWRSLPGVDAAPGSERRPGADAAGDRAI